MGGKGLDYHMAEKRALLDKPWDVVVAHGFSTLDEAHPGDPALLLSSSKQMADMFAAKNPQVKFYLLATWSRADKVYPVDSPAPWKSTPIQQMGKDVENAYEKAAGMAAPMWRGSFLWGLPGILRLTRAWPTAIPMTIPAPAR